MKYNHFSVLEEEVLSHVDDTKPSIVLDATLGLGGHTPVSYTHLRAHETREDRGWRGMGGKK